MKKMIVILVIASIILLAGCTSTSSSLPEKHAISYPQELQTLNDVDGADAYNGALDQPDSKYFIANDYYNMKSEGTLHILPHFETYQQTTEYTCGCAAAYMVLHNYGIDTWNEMDIASMAGSVENIGTSPEQLCAFFDQTGLTYEFNASSEALFENEKELEAYLIERIDAGEPVLVDWEDFGGHWQVIVGVDTCKSDEADDDVLIFADPYDISDHYQDGYYVFPLGRFYAMWREGACTDKATPDEQPFISPDRP